MRSLPRLGFLLWRRRLLRLLFVDRLVERRYCLRHECCPCFNWNENVLVAGIVLILVLTLSLESYVKFPVNCLELNTHVGIFRVMHFEIIKSRKLIIFLILNLH